MRMGIRYIISDADGTLVDTVKLIRHGQYEAAKTYLERHGVPTSHVPTYGSYEKFLDQAVGGSTRETFERTLRLLYDATPEHLDGINYDELNALLNPIQDRIAPSYVTAMPGLGRFLSWVGKTGLGFAIFTSGTPHHVVRNFGIALPELGLIDLYLETGRSDAEKLELFIKTMEQQFGIEKVVIITCDDVTRTKPDPESLELALKQLNGSSDATAILGDHEVDMATGIRAKVAVRIGITHGFHDRKQLETAGATYVADTLDDVINHLAA